MHNNNPNKDGIINNVVSVYTQNQAIEDGILVEVGLLSSGRRIVFTRNLLESGGYEDYSKRRQLVEKGIALLNKSDPEDTEYMKLRVIEKDKAWVILDGNGLTFLKPEDY